MEIGKEIIVKVERFNNEGDGVCLYNNFVIFVKAALINEEIKIRIIDKKKNYAVGEIVEILIPSESRKIPLCPYYNTCGGCGLMHMDQNMQLELKKEKIKSIFKKICKIDVDIKEVCAYNNLYYRNKITLRVEGNKIGYYKEKTNELVDITECLLCDKRINEILHEIREFINYYSSHKISEVMIRTAKDETMVYIDNINKRWLNKFIEKLSNVNSIYVGDDLVYGIDSINQKINGLVFDMSPKSFFQVNLETASKLYEYALKDVENQNITVDLYSGTGTIAISLAKKSRRVIAIESNKNAVKDAKNNMLLNGIDNIEFKGGKVEDLIKQLKDLNIDTLVLDPPRTGSDKLSLKMLLKIKPKNIVYISCNPVTLAKDYNILKEEYQIKEIKGFDMFPNTHHVETVMVLERKN